VFYKGGIHGIGCQQEPAVDLSPKEFSISEPDIFKFKVPWNPSCKQWTAFHYHHASGTGVLSDFLLSNVSFSNGFSQKQLSLYCIT